MPAAPAGPATPGFPIAPSWPGLPSVPGFPATPAPHQRDLGHRLTDNGSSERANESIQHDKRHWCNAYPACSPLPLRQRAAFTWSSWRTILAVQTVLALGAVLAGHSILAGRPWLTVCAVLAGRTHDTRYAYQSMQLHPTTCQSCHPSWRRIVHKCVHGRELTLRADFAGDAILARRALPARGAVGAGGTRCALSACRAEKIAAGYSSPHKYFPLCMRIQCTASKPSH